MPARLRRSYLALALAAALAPAAALVSACSSDANDAPSGPSVFDPPGAGSGGAPGSSGGAGAGGAAGNAGSGGGGVAPNCLGPDGCFAASCAPQVTEHFLNRCTDASCARFDNAARLPLFNGGSLPPLP
ncbi:MAG TPA: hypothetical protein VFS43_14455 [Polyangiaceae bacterium]|nr:hypothetical protein [Polyangiaceae bacterium]